VLNLIGVKSFIIESATFQDDSGKVNEAGLRLKGSCEKFFQRVKDSKMYGKIVDYNYAYYDDLHDQQ
jgi:hypothetical protein